MEWVRMDTIVVFTAKNMDRIFEQAGSGNWRLDAERAKKCVYAVLTANSYHRGSGHAKDKHGHAFLIGKISGLTSEAYDDLGDREDNRWVIRFSEYAEIDVPDVWGGYRNPIKYGNLSDFGIDPEQIDWKPFPIDRAVNPADDAVPPLTIEEAKLAISKKFGIAPDCIEIIIRA
jgi:hypothetical protein